MNSYFFMEMLSGIMIMVIPFLALVLVKKSNFCHSTGIVLMGIYLGMVWNITGLPGITSFRMEISGGLSLIPFRDVSAFGYTANVIMLMPLGILMPLLWKNCRKLWKTAAAGFMTSLSIECLQLFTFRATDVDDLIMNTLGAAAGYGIFCVIRRLLPKMTETCSGKLSEHEQRNEMLIVLGMVCLLRFIVYPVVMEEWIWGMM
ncbi:MAG: VanZ family protein [Clostridiales bacterium]|nr:VanZ family protein [Clostridiales bacterium]